MEWIDVSYRANEVTVRVLKSAVARNARHDYAQRKSARDNEKSSTQLPLPLASFLPVFLIYDLSLRLTRTL